MFAHILPLQSSLHKRRSSPSYEGICEGERQTRESQRRDQGRSIALEGVRNDGETRAQEDQETPCLCATQGRCHYYRMSMLKC
jgi:hypothetical protein